MGALPSYLGTPTGVEIPSKIFADLQLDSILSPTAQKILSSPCGKELIASRQELMGAILQEENYLRIKDVVYDLKIFQSAFEVWDRCNIATEKTHLLIKLLENYLKVCDSLTKIGDLGSLAKSVADAFSDDEMMSTRTRMAQSIRNSKIIINRTDTYVLTYGERSQVSKFNAPYTYFEYGDQLFAKLGLTTPSPRRQSSKLHPTLSDSVSELFAAEYFRVDGTLDKYAKINFRAIFRYIRELSFYMEMRAFILKVESYNTEYCMAKISDKKCYQTSGLYDISLISKECYNIVPNDTWFSNEDKFFFLTGANGGGKTTYLRAIGINLILFLGGMPVFARSASIYPFSSVYTHFPKDERFASTGRLHEELTRTRAILDQCDNDAFILFNETFSGTDDKKGYDLLLETANEIKERGIGGLYVTHFHEIMDTSFPILGVEVHKDDENKRTFRITRRNNERCSYAYDILRKYGLDKESLAERG